MTQAVFRLILIVFLASCSSLEERSSKLEVGSSRADVAKIMGPAPYKYTHEGVDAWRYAVVAGFGYCDYREFYIFRDSVVYINEYHRASIAGCTAGLRNIDWNPVLTAAEQYDSKTPETIETSENESIVIQLKELKEMRETGHLTEEEYTRAKQSLLEEKM